MKFNDPCLTFASSAQPFLRADDVGYAMTEFMWFEGKPYYPMSALTDARVACVRLSAALYEELDEDNLDLVFQMRGPQGKHLFEIVLRSDYGTAYGGWLWGEDLEIADEFIDGYRVLTTTYDGLPARFEYNRELGQYGFVGENPFEKTAFSGDRTRPLRHSVTRIEAYNHRITR